MDWDIQSNVVKVAETKPEISVPSTERMPPLSDITVKHKVKRRARTGSLTAHYTVPESRDAIHRDNSTAMMPPLTRIRRTPITGGSWDDNSVGHGSVAARMRRERNRAILRTQSSMTSPPYHSIDTHANVTSTLNLINTTALSPLPSERYYDNNEWMKYLWENPPQNYHSVATKTSAGSMCNIPVTGYQSQASHQPWDTLSIPELHSTKSCDRTCHRTHHRHSYSSGYANTSYLHSSPTSGCASIASSDLDSADFMYFNINDDSSYFDGDSLFADSLGMIGDPDTAFSTNILSLLEEGSISCRTPFPASDWPDSISELDFDCSEGKPDDVTNCDALSDIGPSCSSPPQRRRMTKRQSLPQNKTGEAELTDNEVQETVSNTNLEADGAQEEDDIPPPAKQQSPNFIAQSDNNNSAIDKKAANVCQTISEISWVNFTTEEKEEYLRGLSHAITQKLSPEEQTDVRNILLPGMSRNSHSGLYISVEDVDFPKLAKVAKYLDEKKRSSDGDWVLVKSPEQKSNVIKLVKQKKVAKTVKYTNGFDEQLAPCSYLAKASPWKMETCDSVISHFAESSKHKNRLSTKFNLDEIVAKSRMRPGSRQETSSTKGADPQHLESCADPSCKGCSSNLRRSNSDGNLPKSVASEAQKEHRRQQRQARRWAKLMKTRQRKENRQLMKEHRSGLFVNEKKVKLKPDYEQEIDIEIG